MNHTPTCERDPELIELELKQLEDQLADAWWHEQPLERIEHLERQIQERSAILKDRKERRG